MTTRDLIAVRQRIEALECSLRVYRGSQFVAALMRVSDQLDTAYAEQERLLGELDEKQGRMG